MPITGVLTIVVLLSAASCLPESETEPPSTLSPPLPSTTLVPIDLGGTSEAADDTVRTFTGPMLDGSLLIVSSDDPTVPFVGDEPAEIIRITDLAVAGDCGQLREVLEFWLGFADEESESEPDEAATTQDSSDPDDPDEVDAPRPETVVTTGRRASLFARAAFDAIAFIGCGETPDPDTEPAP